MKKVLILFSGGFDSTTLVHLAWKLKYEPVVMAIDYGQRHIDELKAAREFAHLHELEYHEMRIEGLSVHSTLVDGVKMEGAEQVSPYHVPGRNLIFVALAASFAESENIPEIWYGANYEDRENLFPDCYQDWVYHVNQVLRRNGANSVKLVAPLLGLPKEMISDLARELGVDEEKVFSGYGGIRPS